MMDILFTVFVKKVMLAISANTAQMDIMVLQKYPEKYVDHVNVLETLILISPELAIQVT